MSFTYLADFTTARDIVRFEINDKIRNEGPMPDGANISDQEIAYLVSSEGDNNDAAIARCFEALQAAWAQYALSEREGEVSFDTKEVSDKYEDLAEQWWKKSGRRTTGVTPVFSEHQNIFHLGYSQ